MTTKIKLTQTFAPALEVFCTIPTQGETEDVLICWPWPLVPARQPAIQHALTSVICLKEERHKPSSRDGSSSRTLPSRIHLATVIVQVSGKRTVTDGQGNREERKFFNFRHGKTMLTGEGCQEELRHV